MAGFSCILDRSKFLSLAEAVGLLETGKTSAQTASLYNHKTPLRDYFIIDLAMSTGLRVMEMARLKCGDFFADDHSGSVIIRKGKGGKQRLVRFNSGFSRHHQEYLRWKKANGEPVGADDPLLQSSHTRGHMTTRAIEKAFKRMAARAGLPEHFSIHCLRHTYACQLYRASGNNLRLVQKQLGHSRSQTTEIYADVMNPEIIKSLEKLYTQEKEDTTPTPTPY